MLGQEDAVRQEAFLWWAGMGKSLCFLFILIPSQACLGLFPVIHMTQVSHMAGSKERSQTTILQSFTMKSLNQGLRSKNEQKIGPWAARRVQKNNSLI